MDKIKWGIIGCGNVTEIKSGPAFSLVPNSELVAVMRRDAERAKDYAQRHGVSKWYSNSNDLINDAEVNAVYIATPPDSHKDLAISTMKAGKPVYVEKPMALNYEQCKEMIEASEYYQVPLFVAYYRRVLPGFLKVKEWIDAGVIGSVKFVNMQLHKSLSKDEEHGVLPWRVDPEIAGGGHFFDLASHQLDFIDFLFGPVQEVHAFALNQAKKYKAEDIVSASFKLPDNIVVNGSWCFTLPEFLQSDSIEIYGEKGKISLSCFDFSPLELHTEREVQKFNFPKPKHVQYNMIKKVVDDLLGMGKSPSYGKSAARTSWVLDEVVKTYYNKM